MTFDDLAIEAIRFRITTTATWRRRLCERFPDDPRNARAASALETLAASDAGTITADAMDAMGPCIETPAFRYALSDAARDIGYRGPQPDDLGEFVDGVMARITSPQIGGAR